MSKPKIVNFELVKGLTEAGYPTEPYEILAEVRNQSHPDLSDADIALAWRKSTKPDKDGHLVLGKCKKVGDLQKEFIPFDFIILLNREVWDDPEFTPDKKRALIDHELCHADISLDKEGIPKEDDRGRLVYRMKKHDIEEFHAIVDRHGLYKADLVRFAETLLKKKKEMQNA